MSRYLSIPLFSQHLVRDSNIYGRTALFDGGPEGVAEKALKLIEAEGMEGAILQRFHGCLREPVIVGVRPDGEEVETTVGSTDDRDVQDHELLQWEKLAGKTKLAIYTGLPRTARGILRLDEFDDLGLWAMFFDVAGQNESLLAQRALERPKTLTIAEPTPKPLLVPSWMDVDAYTMGLEERYEWLERRQALPYRGMVMFNMNEEGRSYWSEEKASVREEQGYDISIPIGAFS